MPELAAKDACELLDADHIAVKHLFVDYARLAYAPDAPGAAERADIAMKICNELTVHAQIEEEIFYPALRKVVPDAAGLLDEARQEHQQVKNLISQVREMGTADTTMDQLVADLARAVEHHVKEERDELFPKAKAAKGLDLAALGQQLQERQQELEAEIA
ncbi:MULTISPECIES: hemerythrin domain-containing protein [Ramlibacter]|uniref:Hemerythrin domain-containing protein n=1 Tax=Ramlibacter pinisoli TaxID=2682844 RepID=A0A6N8ITP8_9BURK|nr:MULTISPECIES: hemerythrin domain-containing protein [Ramlibacter]MBA2965117.1 hemerythrin domain-containing protein [Ramlibacter sp. CGMCC 1.13660]MVQ30082.1 hemerythrin domain-containing protein [Ramlibacter pinisoli]